MLRPIDTIDFDLWGKRIPQGSLVDRDDVILGLCREMRVLHLGAADAPFHADKAIQRQLLHQKLQPVASQLVGMDSDVTAVAWLRENVGIDDILVADATLAAPAAIEPQIILCCDIIEHVNRPIDLLSACRAVMLPDSILLVISTINATGLRPAFRAIMAREAVHPDHVSYFSYATLAQCCRRAGLVPTYVGFFAYPFLSPPIAKLFRALLAFGPGAADGILMLAKRAAE